MRLVADALDQIKTLRVPGQQQGVGSVREEDLFLLFGQTDNRNFPGEAEFIQHFDGAAQLAFSTVDDHQIRQERKGFVRLCAWGFER